MAFIVRQTQGEGFEPPPAGVHNGVCVDLIDQGMVMGKFGPKHKVRFVFELEMRNAQGQAYWVNEFFTATISEKSNLGKFLAMWRGRPIEPNEEIDIEKCIGIYALLVIDHQTRDGKTYARISAIQRPVKKFPPSGTYNPQATRQRMMQAQGQQRSIQNPAHQQAGQQPVQWRQPQQQPPQQGLMPHQQAPQNFAMPQQQPPQQSFNPQQGQPPPQSGNFAIPARQPQQPVDPNFDVPQDEEDIPF